jgi:hypothetical protein
MQTIQILHQPAIVIPFHADLHVAEDDLERTAQNVHGAIADFYILLRQATTNSRCVQIGREIAQLVECLQVAHDAALDRSERV